MSGTVKQILTFYHIYGVQEDCMLKFWRCAGRLVGPTLIIPSVHIFHASQKLFCAQNKGTFTEKKIQTYGCPPVLPATPLRVTVGRRFSSREGWSVTPILAMAATGGAGSPAACAWPLGGAAAWGPVWPLRGAAD